MIHSEERIIPVRLKDQVVVVTGVSHPVQGGYGLAAAFAKEGALLAISARNAERVDARARELQAEGANVIAIPDEEEDQP
jgi:NAD(P)-dependent dehydrogenase (short-subunit alcohol dehydrogenase family)